MKSDKIKKYENNLINKIIEKILEKNGEKYLTSIVLTGSFGRNEPTYIIENNSFKLKSDIEIALIYKKEKYKKQVKDIIEKTSKLFDEDLNLMAISEKRIKKIMNFNSSIIVPKRKTLFTFDLYNGSKTIWGEKLIENKKVTLNEVDKYESKRIVANRIAEYSYLYNSKNDKNDFELLQWKGKIVLSIGTAILLCEDKYTSSYHEQYKNIKNNIGLINEIVGNDFFKDYEKIFLYLRENATPYEIPEEKLKKYVKKVNLYFQSKKLTKSKVNSLSRLIKYYYKYFKTSKKCSFINLEERILQNVIDCFCNNYSRLIEVSIVWHNVLY